MKKRILSLLLAFAMVLSMIPVQTFAEDEAPTDGATLCPDCKNEVCTCEPEETTEPETSEETTEAATTEETTESTTATTEATSESTTATTEATTESTTATTEATTTPSGDNSGDTDNKDDTDGGNGEDTPEEPGEPVEQDTTNPLVGKTVKFVSSYPYLWKDPTNVNDQKIADSSKLPALLVIADVCVYSEAITLYKLEAAEGYTWPEEYADYYYVESTKLAIVEKCDICGEYDCATEHKKCDTCGEYDCTTVHFYCSICKDYDCGLPHLYCNICEKYDCATEHTFCSHCGDFDCNTQHEDIYKPSTKPVVPEQITRDPDKDVTVVDEYGEGVDTFYLFEGGKSSISAWSELDDNSGATYQWQVRYDSANDLWADIEDQTGKGLLASPAMFRSIIRLQGSAAVRCVISVGEQSLISDPIPVTIQEQPVVAMLNLTPGETPLADEPETDGGSDDDNKVNVIVNYIFTDNKIAANSWVANLPANTAFTTATPITVPTIAGYTPTVGEGAANATLTDYQLTLSFTADDLATDCEINIVYQPAPVKVVVNHYWQNVDNDNYELHETIETTAVTGTTVGDVHKEYEGFYHLLYEHPTVAADGSTVVDVYYDRYYYLMTFDLSGGYNVEPIYARYGARLEVGTPTRPGYTFQGWTLNGADADIPATMPAERRTYTAKWGAEDTEYARAYWVLHDDGTKTYIGSEMVPAVSGITVNGADTLTADTNVCGRSEHTHVDSCNKTCTLPDHTHGDGTCVYICGKVVHDHTSGCDCTLSVHNATQHTRNCYTFTEAIVSDSASNPNSISYYSTNNGFSIYRTNGQNNNRRYYVMIGTSYYQISDYNQNTSLEYTYNPNYCHYHTSACCSIVAHDHSADCCSLHEHSVECFSCGKVAHTHSDSCKTDLYKYVTFIEGDQNVTVDGDGSSIVNVYYEYKTYTIRFIYAVANENNYHIANLTVDGYLDSCSWATSSTLPSFEDPSGKTTASTAVIDGYTCYYISLSAKYGEDISSEWPDSNIGNVTASDYYGTGTYEWGSWAAAPGTGYRIKYGDDHANIVGPYPTMSADMIVDNPELLDDGTYLAQNMIAWWGRNQGIENHAYHNYFEVLPGGDTTDAVLYNGKYYKLVETYTFTAAHNGDTRVDPIFFNGFKCINDSRDTNNDTQANSKNFANNGDCTICGTTCDYCNSFYYDRNVHKLYFWNHNGYLQDGSGSDVKFGTPLTTHGAYVGEAFMNQLENYPENLEPEAYEFDGWYTTSDCLEGTEMDWTTTMPDSDFTVYAKWVPVSRTVRFFLDKEDMEADKIIPDKMAELYAAEYGEADADSPYTKFATKTDVPNKSFLNGVETPGVADGYKDIHPYSGWTFVGWFYQEDGEEKAFDPANMPVTKDMDFYGKWSSNVLCPYEIRYVLDEDGDGVHDANETTYVADPLTGSTLAGNSRTFNAKGDTALYADFQNGYYPNIPSHNVEFKPLDEDGDEVQDLQVYVFLYKKGPAVPYTVKYLEKGTEKVLATQKDVTDNTKAVVTENFKPISGYLPDAYQKTLVVVPESDENVIIFWYTEDKTHAFYQVNHYIQNLKGDGWTEYRTAAFTGEIGKEYSESAIDITGFTFSAELTNQYNTGDKKNMYTFTELPGAVSFSGATVTGTLSANGMELNLYYTRNMHTYKVQYLEYGTNEVLHTPKTVTVPYNTFVSENAVTIEKDMDGDGMNEDFQLYEAKDNPLTATIKDDSTVLTFHYVRCTAEALTVKKVVDDKLTGTHNADTSFNFTLTSTATDFGGENVAYTYELNGVRGTTTAENGVISFSLKDGQTIKFLDLPTAKYTVTEQDIPRGYYCTEPSMEVLLTKDATVDVTITNKYEPTTFRVAKIVNKIDEDEEVLVDKFEFYIKVPNGVTGTYSYTVGPVSTNDTESVPSLATVDANGIITIQLADGEEALFMNLPEGEYTVWEKDYTHQGYSATYSDLDEPKSDGKSVLKSGEIDRVVCTNAFPVGSLTITKIVQKAYEPDEWESDTFTFTVTRTDDQVLENEKSYPVYSGTEVIEYVTVADNKLTVKIPFDALGTKTIKIDNLPKGDYKVTEDLYADYTQSERVKETSISPEDYAGTAEFTNTYNKHLGDLTITKTVNALTGYTAPEGAAFEFTVSGAALTKSTYTVSIKNGEGEVTGSLNCNVNGGKLTVSLFGGQSAVIHDLDLAGYTVEEAANDQFVMTSSTGTTGTVLADDTANAVFTNTYVPRGSLQVNKYIDRGNLDYVTIDAGQEFEFTLTLDYSLNNAETYTAKVYSPNAEPTEKQLTLSTDKKLTFKLKHGEYIVINGLPAVGYTLSETQVEGYKTPDFKGNETGTIPADETKMVECYNIIQMMPGDLKITKVIDDTTPNGLAPKDTLFTFNVVLSNLAEIPEVDEYGFTVNDFTVEYTCDPDKGTLSTLENGKQQYMLKSSSSVYELPTTVKIETGIENEYTFSVKLCDGMSATIKGLPSSAYYVVETAVEGFGATYVNQTGHVGGAKTKDPIPTAVVDCTNTYPVNLNGVLQIKKQVTKDYQRDVLPADTFTFTVKPSDGNNLEGEYTVKVSKVYTLEQDAETVENTYKVTASNNQLVVSIPFTAEELKMDLNDSRSKLLSIEGLPMGQYDVMETKDVDYRQEPETLLRNVAVSSNPGVATFVNRYRRHLGTLEIVKEVTGTNATDTFIFHISGNGVEMDVTIDGSGSVKIYDLPLGTYTVTEDTSWSWRYDLSSSNTEDDTITLDDLHAKATFTNQHSTDMWLNFSTVMENVFGNS